MNCKIIFSIFFLVEYSLGDEYTHLIKDFVKNQKEPTKLNLFLCRREDKIANAYKILFKHGISAKITKNFNGINHNLPEEHQMFALDMSCVESKKILEIADKQLFFKNQFRWFIWNFNSLQDLKDYYFGVDSKIFVVEKDGIENRISSIYKYSHNSTTLVKREIATWSIFGGLSISHMLNLVKDRTDLMGLPIGVSYVVTNPDTMKHLHDYRHKHIDSITKNAYFLIEHLFDKINGSIVPYYQKSWGYLNKSTGLYDGLIGDLQRGLAEIGGTPSFFTPDRVFIVDYTAVTTKTFMKFIFRQPPLTYVTNVFTLPFDTYVWYACFVTIALVMVVTYIIVYWEWNDPIFSKNLNHQDFTSPMVPNAADICIAEVGLITQQGSESEPKSSAGRIATIFVMISLMFLYAAYSANIVALLQSRTDSIKTLQDVLNSRIKLGVEDIVYAHHYFKSVTEPVRKAIYDQKVAPKGQKSNFMKIEEGIAKMRSDFFAFHVEVSRGYKVVADTFQENEKCGLQELVFFNNIIEPSLQVRKNTTYKELVKVNMEQIHESGLSQREYLRIYTRKPVCTHQGSSFDSVGLIDCYAAFLVFGIGIGISLILGILEVLIHHYKERITYEVKNIRKPA